MRVGMASGNSGGTDRVEEREAKSRALREILDASIAEGGGVTDEELGASLEAKAAALAKAGF